MAKKITKDNFVRSQFTFYRSFWDTAKLIREPEKRCQAYDVLCSYALTNEQPKLEEMSDIVQMYFLAHQINLDRARENAWNAGAEKEIANVKRTRSERGANAKRTDSESEANAKRTDSESGANAKRTGSKSQGKGKGKESEPGGNDQVDIDKEIYKEIYNEKEMSLIETSKKRDFEIFWAAYPKHVDRVRAEKAFARVDVPLKELLEGLEHHKAYNPSWQKNGGQYIPHGANWLEDARWKDRFDDTPVRDPNGKASCRYGESEKAAALLTLSE